MSTSKTGKHGHAKVRRSCRMHRYQERRKEKKGGEKRSEKGILVQTRLDFEC
jgi:hypothetical protein